MPSRPFELICAFAEPIPNSAERQQSREINLFLLDLNIGFNVLKDLLRTTCAENFTRKSRRKCDTQNLLSDPERSLVERFGFGILAIAKYSSARLLSGLSSLFAVDSSRLGANKRIVSDINFYSYRCRPSWRDTRQSAKAFHYQPVGTTQRLMSSGNKRGLVDPLETFTLCSLSIIAAHSGN